jgi:hypothetical protein
MWERDEREQIVKKLMSCVNLLNHGDILIHQSQKEFNSFDLGVDKLK